MKLLFSLIALIITTELLSQQTGANNSRNDSEYIADASIQLHDLKNYTSVFADSSNKMTIQEVASEKFSNRFQPLSGMIQPAQPYITYWLKLSITASGDIQNWWLLLDNDPESKKYTARNCYVDAWFFNTINQITEHQRTGVFVPRSQKAIKENTWLNRILFSAKAGETKVVYLRIYNEYDPALISSPQLRNPLIGISGRKPNVLLLTALSSAAFVFSIISFFFFFFVGEKAYLFFGFYTLLLSQQYLLLHPDLPFTDLYIPEHPGLAVPAFLFLTNGSFMFFVLFGRSFINLPQLSKRLDAVLIRFMIVWGISLITIVVITALTHHNKLIEVLYIFILLFLIFLFRIAFFKTILVRFYVAGALWLIVFTITGLLWNNSLLALPFNPWPVGPIGQLLIYAAGLAYKVRLNEKARTQAELIRLRNIELAGLYSESKKQKEEIEVQKKNAEEALLELKATQSQLIQSEKMASLGELTAGIAHEIQNPLNFVNNFSEVNSELIGEMKQEIDKRNFDEVKTIANDIDENEQKIIFHGKRADAIVKGMLQHSRSNSGVKEPTDINALADEYLRLAYHGLRAKDKSFNATMKTDFDEKIGNINIVPQDIGRVILNLITNAFYATNEKQKQSLENYEPIVTVKTLKNPPSGGRGAGIEIRVRDNGNGIPQKVVDKIFQPFFTTKPTGQGTGLGLSLSYDIIKAHGGELKVETKENEFAEFVITLPE